MSSDVVGRPDAGPRRLTDPRTMRALAHPVRMALVELLSIDGPHTATQAAERIGESPSNCSFHLRQLAKYGFVEETGEGTGRQRPWRMTQLGTTFDTAHDDPATALAAEALGDMFNQRVLDRWQEWRATRHAYPAEWRDVAGSTESVWWLTPQELREMQDELVALALRYRDRLTDPSRRPAGAEPVEYLGMVFPMRPPRQD